MFSIEHMTGTNRGHRIGGQMASAEDDEVIADLTELQVMMTRKRRDLSPVHLRRG